MYGGNVFSQIIHLDYSKIVKICLCVCVWRRVVGVCACITLRHLTAKFFF